MALAGGSTVEACAALVQVRRETVSRWRNHDATFRNELDRLREEQAAEAVAHLRALLAKTVEVLDGALADPERQLQAAALVLRHVGPNESRVDVRGGLTLTAARATDDDELTEQEVALATEILDRERARLAPPTIDPDSTKLTIREPDTETKAGP